MTDASGIPDPTDPASQPAGSVTPAVPAIVPRQGAGQFPLTPSYGGTAGPLTGKYSEQILNEMKAKYGLQDYLPQRLTPYTTRPLAPLGPDDPVFKAPGMGEGDPTADRFGGDVMPVESLGEVADWILKPASPGMKGGSMQRSLGIGFGDTLYGAALSWHEMQKAIGTVADPDYDPYRDRQIMDAGMGNQMSLFWGSQSRQQSEWLIQHVREQQRDAEWINKSGIIAKSFAFAGGVLGDPMNLLPGDIGIKGAVMLNRLRQGLATGAEVSRLAAKPALYGSLIDGARSIGLQFGLSVAEQALSHSLDPTIPGDLSTDLALPTIIAGSVGMLTGLRSRLAARKLALEVQNPNFLRPEGPPESGFPGRRYGAIRETLEKIPEPLKEKAKDELKDQVVDQLNEGQPTVAKHPSNNGAFAPGALATDYGPMRKAEHQANPAAAGFHEPVVHSAEGRRSEAVPQPTLTLADGRIIKASDYRVDANIVGADGQPWKIVGHNGKPIGWVPAPEVAQTASERTGGRGFIETSEGALPPSPPPGRKLRAGELAEQPAMDLAREFHEATGKRLVDVEFRTGDPIAEARQMMEDARAGKSLEREGTTYPAGPTARAPTSRAASAPSSAPRAWPTSTRC